MVEVHNQVQKPSQEIEGKTYFSNDFTQPVETVVTYKRFFTVPGHLFELRLFAQNELVPEDQATTPTAAARRSEHQARFDAAVERLPTTDRRIIQLVLVDKRPYEEAAELLGWKPGSVRSRVTRIVRELAKDLQ